MLVRIRPRPLRRKGQAMKKYFIYYRQLDTFIEVTKEQYYSYYRYVWRHLYARKRDNECALPKNKLLYCDADCIGCRYRCFPRATSLDAYSAEGTENVSLSEVLASDCLTPEEEMIAEFEAEEHAETERKISELLSRLPEQYGRAYDLIKSGATIQEAADALGITYDQFRYLKSKLFDMIKKVLK